MQPETVYNPTTIAGGSERGGYLDSISQDRHGRRRCCTLTIAVAATICTLIGLALTLYGSVFHYHYTGVGAPPAGSDSERRLRHQSEVRLYRALLAAGVPLLVAAAALWTAYLYRRGRCRDCWLCPGARKRRRMRNNFRTQCLEAGNLTTCYPSRPSQPLSQEEDRLVSQSLDEVAGLDDTDAMLDSGPRPIIRPAQRAT
ncbi:hypothetical protein FJT64_003959 [Amphibalanus amphitrite]|uniref:Uncharacterized protein n=1 Tax=Amphibalanus amphitrite TaxID=1232801 RepID=A0A6A4VR53_AMPAM|nr:hypothetical protein FJT64_003959 [Amphibalanus amphitrite]KAF0298687.1 hypothetical protein FJT64_003959 [Amphibalanus amphitrite]